MNFHDPLRPRSAHGSPLYLSPGGRPIAPLQALSFLPLAEGKWSMHCYLLTGHVTGTLFQKVLEIYEPQQIGYLLADFAADPEDFFTREFGYSGAWRDTKPLTTPTVQLPSLSDLGLA